jgi:hypothetical protein
MKTFSILSLVSALILTGCGESSKSTASATNDTSGNPLTAPVDYLDAVSQAQKKMVKTIDTTELNHAVQAFNAGEEHFPKDLNEMVQKGYIREIPTPPFGMKFDYDPNTGTVKVVKK